MEALFLFLFGLCVGSFLNCLVYRLNSSTSEVARQRPRLLRGVLGGRSFCDHCKHQLAWSDNIPLLSFVFLRGRCRYCHSPISWQYPLVELGTGILFVMVTRNTLHVTRFDDSWLYIFYLLLVTCCLVAIFVSDLRYGTIPDEIVYPAMGLAIVFHLRGVSPPSAGALHLGGVLLSGLGATLLFWTLVLVTHAKGMGMGDVKLAGLMGLVLGWPKILVALYLAFLTGAMVGVILILLKKRRFGQPIPFGPFLASATWIALLWGEKASAWLKF